MEDFDTKIAQALLGKSEIDGAAHQSVWNSIAFYNFVRRLMKNSDDRPTTADHQDPQAKLAFREVLADLQPARIIVFSDGVWRYAMPPFDESDAEATAFVGSEAGWYLTPSGSRALAVGVYHPSAWNLRHKQYDHWHPFISRALQYPQY